MIQTYQGYFVDDGQFIADGTSVRLPTRRRAVVNIFEDDIADSDVALVDSAREQKIARIQDALAKAQAAEDELSEEDWEEFKNLRLNNDKKAIHDIEYASLNNTGFWDNPDDEVWDKV
ncbi:MAG: hypothetical protein FWC13_10555 [Oscillospiraceae bacterium]|nr:hypothetical protein [Oscillospiraceae bacterium]